MATHRPTFSESWSRIADLKPRLRAAAQVHRQWFRGRAWRVVRDAASNQHFRISQQAYNFLGRLDGERTVEQAWRASAELDGDDAVSQPEALDLLARLYDANLLATDRPGDARSLLARRRQRVSREMKGHLQSIFFARIPLFDPDALLTRWRPIVGWLFSPLGLALWLALITVGAVTMAGRFGTLASEAANTLDPDNLVWLYLAYVVIKGLHELGHGFACKQFGVASGGDDRGGGEVHAMGIALLIFIPVPYVDASSAWSLRSRTQRIIVSLAGVMVELACAAIAAVVWVSTSPGSLPHVMSANIIVLASVSTLIFNGNPLLRFDAYYAISDLLDIPNLWQRSREQLHYLVKRFIFGLRSARAPAFTLNESALLTVYAVSSSVYRVFLSAAIVLMLAQRFFIVGVALALFGVVLWGVAPLGRFIRYLSVNPEITRVRTRAQLASLAIISALVVFVGMIPVPAHVRLEGVVEPVRRHVVRAGVDGFLTSAVSTGAPVRAGDSVAALASAELNAELTSALALRDQHHRRLAVALTSDPAAVEPYRQRIEAIETRIARLERDRDALTVTANVNGVWIAPSLDDLLGSRIERGRTLGVVASLNDLRVRANADQASVGALTPMRQTLNKEPGRLRIRVEGRPGQTYEGAGFTISAAAGPVDDADAGADTVFEVLAPLAKPAGLFPGQRVIVRVELDDATIAKQAYLAFRRLIQRRFSV